MGFIRHQDVVADRTDVFGQAHHQFFPDRINRRISYLRELLSEIIEKQLRFGGQDGQRRVVSHRTDRLCSGCTHRNDDAFDIFLPIVEKA